MVAEETDSAKRQRPEVLTKNTAEISILIIDDDEALLNCYLEALEQEGYSAASTLTRDAAFEWLKRNPSPDLIFLDCRMEGISNEEFRDGLAEIQKNRTKSRVIGFSAFSEKSPFAQEMREVFGDFIEKPNDLYGFLALLDRLFL